MKNISFLSENFQFLEVKCSIYLNRRVFVIASAQYNQPTKGYSVGSQGSKSSAGG